MTFADYPNAPSLLRNRPPRERDSNTQRPVLLPGIYVIQLCHNDFDPNQYNFTGKSLLCVTQENPEVATANQSILHSRLHLLVWKQQEQHISRVPALAAVAPPRRRLHGWIHVSIERDDVLEHKRNRANQHPVYVQRQFTFERFY
ncbi:hypothetical protein BC938DRAFT_477212 [Jimgerdemannia flammicorona]|uniref:Uncharacterized protein n=1 Tax=Jimgerdemannia flammicorona TaxID=994334 RepID=A0A433QPL6_9FUNG|nr:hypothetical protein BC938DRAFT_477212 [Jimgerdemannia flammicorona]